MYSPFPSRNSSVSGGSMPTKADIGLGLVDNTSDLNKPISILQQAALDNISSNFSDLVTSLADVVNTTSETFGQQVDFSALSNTSIVNSRTYAIRCATGGKLVNLVLFSTTAPVTVKAATWTWDGTTLVEHQSVNILVNTGLNQYTLDLEVPVNGAFGVSGNPTFYLGQNSTIPDIELLYSGNVGTSITGVTTTTGFNAMMYGVVENTVTIADTLDASLDGFRTVIQTVTDRYGYQDDVSLLTRTSVAGATFAVYPDLVVNKDGTVETVEFLSPSITTYKLLVWNYDIDTGVYTLDSSTNLPAVVGYNSVTISLPVTKGQVFGFGGSVGTVSGVPTTRLIYGGTTVNNVTTITDGVDQTGQFAVVVSMTLSRQAIPSSFIENASLTNQKTISVIGIGQSNRRGFGISNIGGTPYGNTMFAAGLLTQDTASPDRSSIIPINDTAGTGMAIALGYTVELEMAAKSTDSWSSISKRYFATCPAWNGATITDLTDYEGSRWPAVRDDLREMGKAIASAGQTPQFGFISWVHGYANRFDARGVYLEKLKLAYERIKGVGSINSEGYPMFLAAQMPHHKQNAEIPSFSINAPNAALDTRDFAMGVGGEIYPLYQVNWADDGIHMSREGKIHAALYEGKIIYDLGSGNGYSHVRCDPVNLATSTIVLNIKGGNGSYVFDTTTIPATPNMGFDIYDASNNLIDNRITSVTLTGTSISVVLNQVLAPGEKLTYGWGRPDIPMPTNAAPAPYQLGNLRDTDSRSKLLEGNTYNLYNWSAIQEMIR